MSGITLHSTDTSGYTPVLPVYYLYFHGAKIIFDKLILGKLVYVFKENSKFIDVFT